MAFSLRERAELTDDMDFRRAVKIAMVKTALGTFSARQGRESDFASQVLRDPEQYVWNFVLSVAANIDAPDPTDEVINMQVANVWAPLAGK